MHLKTLAGFIRLRFRQYPPASTNHTSRRETAMSHKLSLASFLALAPALASANINIVFDYSYDSTNFFGATQKSLLEAAAGVFESRITDKLGAIVSSGPNRYDLLLVDPGNLSTPIELRDQTIGANELRIYVGAGGLGGNTLGMAGPGGWQAWGTPDFLGTLNRGQAGVVRGRQQQAEQAEQLAGHDVAEEERQRESCRRDDERFHAGARELSQVGLEPDLEQQQDHADDDDPVPDAHRTH